MDRPALMAITLAFLVVLLLLMVWGWRARQRRQSGIPQPLPVPAELGAVHGEFEGFYVASTVAGEPLNRIAVRGLGYRSRASVTVTDAGAVLSIRGQAGTFIPTAAIRSVTRATWTIDRVVEDGGLVLLAWTLGDGDASTDIDSYFRLPESQPLLDALGRIFPAPTGRKA